MRLMYDAVNAKNIPTDAKMVAGYVDQIVIPPWTTADWNRFPSARKVQIVKKASSNFGNILDVEEGDATPAQAPGWVQRRRAAGAVPTVYCNESTWAAVRTAFDNQNVAEPSYWIAKYDGVDTIPPAWAAGGCVAKQYKNTPGYDLSIVADYWPGVDPTEDDMPTTDEIFTKTWYNALWTITNADGSKSTPNASQVLAMLRDQLTALSASVAGLTALVTALSKDNALTTDAVKNIVTEAVVQNLHITGTVEVTGE